MMKIKSIVYVLAVFIVLGVLAVSGYYWFIVNKYMPYFESLSTRQLSQSEDWMGTNYFKLGFYHDTIVNPYYERLIRSGDEFRVQTGGDKLVNVCVSTILYESQKVNGNLINEIRHLHAFIMGTHLSLNYDYSNLKGCAFHSIPTGYQLMFEVNNRDQLIQKLGEPIKVTKTDEVNKGLEKRVLNDHLEKACWELGDSENFCVWVNQTNTIVDYFLFDPKVVY